jgi:ribosomal protein L37AE/L43A
MTRERGLAILRKNGGRHGGPVTVSASRTAVESLKESAMIDLECPNCGRVGSIPQNKANDRLVCRKCHMVFHMGATGRAVLGEPPTSKASEHGHGHDHGHSHSAATAVKAASSGIAWGGFGELNPGLIGVLVLLVVIGGVAFIATRDWSSSASLLDPSARSLAEALEAGDVKQVEQLATADSTANTAAWFEATSRMLQEMKQRASGHELKIQGVVMEQNPATGSGQITLFVMPLQGATRNSEITLQAGATTGRPTQITTFWLFTGGQWRFDGKRTQQEGSTRSG